MLVHYIYDIKQIRSGKKEVENTSCTLTNISVLVKKMQTPKGPRA